MNLFVKKICFCCFLWYNISIAKGEKMKKLFLIFGLVVGLSATNGYAAAIGERLRTTNGWMACPPGCTFLRDSNGGLVAPLTCVDHGIECAGRNGGVRIYADYPTSYSLGEEAPEEEIADVANVIVNVKNQKIDKKMDTAVSSVARAAKVSKAQRTDKNKENLTVDEKEIKELEDIIKEKRGVGWVTCPGKAPDGTKCRPVRKTTEAGVVFTCEPTGCNVPNSNVAFVGKDKTEAPK